MHSYICTIYSIVSKRYTYGHISFTIYSRCQLKSIAYTFVTTTHNNQLYVPQTSWKVLSTCYKVHRCVYDLVTFQHPSQAYLDCNVVCWIVRRPDDGLVSCHGCATICIIISALRWNDVTRLCLVADETGNGDRKSRSTIIRYSISGGARHSGRSHWIYVERRRHWLCHVTAAWKL